MFFDDYDGRAGTKRRRGFWCIMHNLCSEGENPFPHVWEYRKVDLIQKLEDQCNTITNLCELSEFVS